jgi:hypothetical protein
MAGQQNTRVVNGINTRVLHNKDYVEVSERTRILHELRKAGEIKEFEMVESEPREIGARLVWRCSALIDGKRYIGNAEVKLDAPKNTPDGTNPFECAETSAFGRMLAFAGLGTIESIASYEEIVRGQPFVAVIEQAQTRVVESSKQRQIAQPQATVVDAAKPQEQSAPTIEEIKTLCDTVYGPGNWTRVKAMIFDPEKHGDLADEVMSQAQRAKAYGMLIARQKALAKADVAAASAASSK